MGLQEGVSDCADVSGQVGGPLDVSRACLAGDQVSRGQELRYRLQVTQTVTELQRWEGHCCHSCGGDRPTYFHMQGM